MCDKNKVIQKEKIRSCSHVITCKQLLFLHRTSPVLKKKNCFTWHRCCWYWNIFFGKMEQMRDYCLATLLFGNIILMIAIIFEAETTFSAESSTVSWLKDKRAWRYCKMASNYPLFKGVMLVFRVVKAAPTVLHIGFEACKMCYSTLFPPCESASMLACPSAAGLQTVSLWRWCLIWRR